MACNSSLLNGAGMSTPYENVINRSKFDDSLTFFGKAGLVETLALAGISDPNTALHFDACHMCCLVHGRLVLLLLLLRFALLS